jgi:hypothetical protein
MSFSLTTYNDADRDFPIGADGRLQLVIDVDTIVERLRTRLATWLGDWYLDTTVGIDYKNQILGQSRNGGAISSILRREILLESGVERIDSFVLTQDSDNPRGFTASALVTITGSDQPVAVTV